MTETVIRIPTLRVDDLVLRAPHAGDFEAFAAFRTSERARQVGGPWSRAEAFEQLAALVGHWQLRGFGRWIVAEARSDAALGVVGPFLPEGWPEPEIAWSLFAAAEGRGIAFAAAQAARAYAYSALGWRTAVSLVAPGNRRSIALAERLGATFERTFEHPRFGTLHVYRHPSAAAVDAAAGPASAAAIAAGAGPGRRVG